LISIKVKKGKKLTFIFYSIISEYVTRGKMGSPYINKDTFGEYIIVFVMYILLKAS